MATAAVRRRRLARRAAPRCRCLPEAFKDRILDITTATSLPASGGVTRAVRVVQDPPGITRVDAHEQSTTLPKELRSGLRRGAVHVSCSNADSRAGGGTFAESPDSGPSHGFRFSSSATLGESRRKRGDWTLRVAGAHLMEDNRHPKRYADCCQIQAWFGTIWILGRNVLLALARRPSCELSRLVCLALGRLIALSAAHCHTTDQEVSTGYRLVVNGAPGRPAIATRRSLPTTYDTNVEATLAAVYHPVHDLGVQGWLFNAKGVTIPVATSVFPGEQYQAPRSWAEQSYPNLIYYHQVDKGGHFAAWEQPQLFTEELRAAFRSLR
jgi:hypothetical protein